MTTTANHIHRRGGTVLLAALAATLVTQGWKVFSIGFYGDDWLLERFVHSIYWDYHRPFWTLLHLPASVFAEMDPVRWGIARLAATMVLVGTFYFYLSRLVTDLLGDISSARQAAALTAAAIPLFPWSFSLFTWTMVLPLVIALTAVAACGLILHSRLRPLPAALLLFALYGMAGATYEAVWGMFVPVLALRLATMDGGISTAARRLALPAGALAAAQILVTTYHRIANDMLGNQRALGAEPALLYLENTFIRLPYELLASFGLLALPVLVALITLLPKIARAWSHRSPTNRRSLRIAAAAVGFGMALAPLPYSMAGIRLSGSGDTNYYLIAFDFWFAVTAALTIAFLAGQKSRSVIAAGFVITMSLLIMGTMRPMDWAAGLSFQREAAAALPMERLRQAEADGAAVLAVLDPPANAFHGIHNSRGVLALINAYRAHFGLSFKDSIEYDLKILPANPQYWRTEWDGTRVVMRHCADGVAATWSDTRALYVWTFPGGSWTRASAPFSTGCTQPMDRWDPLREFLYPFSRNPKRA